MCTEFSNTGHIVNFYAWQRGTLFIQGLSWLL